MKKIYAVIFLALFVAGQTFGQQKKYDKSDRLKIYREMKRSMVDELLKPWYTAAIDHEYGGFLSTFTYDFKRQGNQDKMIVTQGRHVWSNTKAAEMFPKDTWYRKG